MISTRPGDDMLATGIKTEPAWDDKLFRAAAVFIVVVSVTGFFLALWTGGLVAALHELLGAIGLASRNAEASPYPLGVWTLLIYVTGAVLGFLARRHALAVTFALLPLAVIALLYGGPITRAYGVILIVAAAALLAAVLYRRAHPLPRPY